jgi:hypothetical protein
MRDRICERLQFLVDGLEFCGTLYQFLIETFNFLLPALAISDVVVCFQYRNCPPLLILPQRPSACYHHPGSVGFGLPKFTFPTACTQQLRANFFDRYRKLCLQEFVTALPIASAASHPYNSSAPRFQ